VISDVSLVLAATLVWIFHRRRQIHSLLWAIAAIVFFAAALLLAIRALAVLGEPYVPVVTVFILAFFADGVLFASFKERKYGPYHPPYVGIMIITLALVKAMNLGAVATPYCRPSRSASDGLKPI
jgi:hypothetical protein